jgi:hypothetical protein
MLSCVTSIFLPATVVQDGDDDDDDDTYNIWRNYVCLNGE